MALYRVRLRSIMAHVYVELLQSPHVAQGRQLVLYSVSDMFYVDDCLFWKKRCFLMSAKLIELPYPCESREPAELDAELKPDMFRIPTSSANASTLS